MSSDRRRPLALLLCLSAAMLLSTAPRAQRQPILLIPAPSAGLQTSLAPSAQAALAQFRARIARDGEISVIVEVRAPGFNPAGALEASEETVQAALLSEARQRVIRRLPPQTEPVREFDYIPFIALVADAATFEVLLSDPNVVSIQEEFGVPPALAQSVPLIQAPTVWAKGYTGAGIAVAVLDSGVEKGHPIFGDGVVSEACYSGGGKKANSLCRNGALSSTASGSAAPCTYDRSACSHGTHVTAIAAGLTGVAKGSPIIAVQVFSKSGSEIRAMSGDLVKALERVYALRTKYSIASVNMSIGDGGYTATCDGVSRALTSIVTKLTDARIAVVVASGNDSYINALSWPACISKVVSVGNSTKSDKMNSGSNRASFLKLLAPGTEIRAAVPGGAYGYKTGTSMAAPHVAGAWALLVQKTPSLTVAAGLTALRNGGLKISDSGSNLAFRRIRVNNSINKLKALARTTLSSPSGTSPSTRPKYTWSKVSASTHYRLWVERAGSDDAVINTWYTADSVCGSTCSVTPSVTLSPGTTYNWWVQTYEIRVGPWSAGKQFTTPGAAR